MPGANPMTTTLWEKVVQSRNMHTILAFARLSPALPMLGAAQCGVPPCHSRRDMRGMIGVCMFGWTASAIAGNPLTFLILFWNPVATLPRLGIFFLVFFFSPATGRLVAVPPTVLMRHSTSDLGKCENVTNHQIPAFWYQRTAIQGGGRSRRSAPPPSSQKNHARHDHPILSLIGGSLLPRNSAQGVLLGARVTFAVIV